MIGVFHIFEDRQPAYSKNGGLFFVYRLIFSLIFSLIQRLLIVPVGIEIQEN